MRLISNYTSKYPLFDLIESIVKFHHLDPDNQYVLYYTFRDIHPLICQSSSSVAYYYIYFSKTSTPLLEAVIAKDAYYSCLYAENVLNDMVVVNTGPHNRFYLGEPAIAKSSYNAVRYAYHILQSRFPEAEEVIATDGFCSIRYASRVINGRFQAGEKAILELDDELSQRYIAKFLSGNTAYDAA